MLSPFGPNDDKIHEPSSAESDLSNHRFSSSTRRNLLLGLLGGAALFLGGKKIVSNLEESPFSSLGTIELNQREEITEFQVTLTPTNDAMLEVRESLALASQRLRELTEISTTSLEFVVPSVEKLDLGSASGATSRDDISRVSNLILEGNKIVEGTSSQIKSSTQLNEALDSERLRIAKAIDALSEIARVEELLIEIERNNDHDRSELERIRKDQNQTKEALQGLFEQAQLQSQKFEKLQVDYGVANQSLLELTEQIKVLTSQLEALKQHKKINVQLVAIDIYNDGSRGKDCWSTWCEINSESHVVWNKKTEISDDNQKTGTRGPGGDKDFTTYWIKEHSYTVEVKPGEPLAVSFWGTAHDQNRAVERSQVVFRSDCNWGIGGDANTWSHEGMHTHRIGGHNGNTEYYLYFWIKDVTEI